MTEIDLSPTMSGFEKSAHPVPTTRSFIRPVNTIGIAEVRANSSSRIHFPDSLSPMDAHRSPHSPRPLKMPTTDRSDHLSQRWRCHRESPIGIAQR